MSGAVSVRGYEDGDAARLVRLINDAAPAIDGGGIAEAVTAFREKRTCDFARVPERPLN